jgi:phosphoribosylformimino-5-aminoimidazole carboxamide ribotide isomerase
MIIPAIDLMNGKIVRLYQGNYEKKIDYNKNIYSQLEHYCTQGATNIHIVDHDGAKNPKNIQIGLCNDILSKFKIVLQIGGGIREEKDIENLFKAGATRVVIGSYAIKNKEEVKNWFNNYGSDFIVLALDVRVHANNYKEVLMNAWQSSTKLSLENLIEEFSSVGLKHVLCTDISKDGTLSGPNFNLYKEISHVFKDIKLQSSGGISSLKDIVKLKSCGVKSIIIGRSLLENTFTVSEAIQCWQNA